MVSFLKVKSKVTPKVTRTNVRTLKAFFFYCNFGGDTAGNRRYLDGILAVLPSFFMPQYKQREG
jgi:hypothetical protein